MTETDREAQFGQLADEFLGRLERGECPTTEEYTTAHPDVADLIREGFPLIRVLRPNPNLAEVAVPPRLGEFRILRQIGRGGMGVVYEAIQEPLGRHVAVKALAGAAANDAIAVERFRREARTAAGLHHTNIVPVFAVGEQDGVPYFAMQLIEGQPLDRRANASAALISTPRDGATTPSAAVVVTSRKPDASSNERKTPAPVAQHHLIARLGLQAAEAIAYAHAQGVLHRDVKPSNLLLDSRGVIWVTDFGLAKPSEGPNLTATGDVVGTLRYLAPERFKGNCDARSDIYSLGATLYELLSGRPLFDGVAGPELVERVGAGRLSSLRQFDRSIPRDLDTVVRKAMALSPGDRYSSAVEFAEDLRLFIIDQPVKARRHTWPEQLWRISRHRPAFSGLVAAVATLVIGIAVIGWVSAYRQRAAERDTKERLLQSQIHQAQASILSGRPGQRFDTLATVAEAAKLARELHTAPEVTAELRRLATAALALPDARQTRAWEGWTPGTAALAVDPRGELFARSDWAGNIAVKRIDGGEDVRSIPGPGAQAQYLKFSPDGRHLAAQYASDTDLRIWSLFSGGTDRRLPVFGSVDFSPDGSSIAIPNRPDPASPNPPPAKQIASRLQVPAEPTVFLKAAVGISIVDLRTGVESQRLPAAGGPNQCVFHPGGRKLAVLSTRPQLAVVHDLTAPGKPQVVMKYDIAHDLVWNDAGDRLAIIGEVITVRDPEDPLGFTEIPSPGSLVNSAMFTRDGLLVGLESESFRVWDPPTRGIQLSLPGQHVRLGGIVARSELIAFGGGKTIAQWEVTRSPVCRPLGQTYQHQGFEVRDINWSRDGRFLACASPKGSAIYETATGREAAWIEEDGNVTAESASWIAGDSVLLTSGAAGLWLRDATRTAEGKLTLGTRMPVEGASTEPSWYCTASADGRLAAVPIGAGNRRVFVIDLEKNRGRFLSEEFPLLRFGALSPDCRWLAASTWGDTPAEHRAVLWDLSDGKVAKRFKLDEIPASGRVAFSPDGKWLLTSAGEEYRLWSVGNWEPGPRKALPPSAVPGPVAFSRTNSMLAVEWGHDAIRLLAPDTLDELLTLSAPGQVGITFLAFSQDGDRLAVGCESGVTYVWDLKQLHTELAEFGLAWD